MDKPFENAGPNTDLALRIQTASPEQMAALLLEGAQRFLGLAMDGLNHQDQSSVKENVGRVSEFIFELTRQLNRDQEGDLVANLLRMYNWWLSELHQGSLANDLDRLRRVSTQMGEMRGTWDDLHRLKSGGGNR